MQVLLKAAVAFAVLMLAGCNGFDLAKGVVHPMPTVACIMMPDDMEACQVR